MWNLIGLLVSFSLIIFLVRRERSFGLAMLLASGVLAIFSQGKLSLRETITVFKNAAISVDTLAITIGVAFIWILASVMKGTGEISGIREGLRARMPREGILASVPAVFGLLPMPGGALMSAPVIEEEGERLKISGSVRAFFNLWFRHIGFLIFPLAAPLLILSQEAGIALHQLIFIQVPVFLVALLTGIFILWNRTRGLEDESPEEMSEEPDTGLVLNLSPIAVSVIIFLLFSYQTPLSYYLSLAVSIPFGILTAVIIGEVSSRETFRMIKEEFSIDLPLAVFGIMIFYKVIQASGLDASLSEALIGTFLPTTILIVLISFFLGFSMGHNIGAVGVSYSILASTISGDLPLISLVYLGAFFGYLISPIHLCVAVSYEYFDSDFANFYKVYLPPTFVVLAFSLVFMVLI